VNIIITGQKGLIGSFLEKRLVEENTLAEIHSQKKVQLIEAEK